MINKIILPCGTIVLKMNWTNRSLRSVVYRSITIVVIYRWFGSYVCRYVPGTRRVCVSKIHSTLFTSMLSEEHDQFTMYVYGRCLRIVSFFLLSSLLSSLSSPFSSFSFKKKNLYHSIVGKANRKTSQTSACATINN